MPPPQSSSPSVQARASTGGNRGPLRLPTIRLIDGQLPRIAMEAEAALLAANLSIYQRGQLVMRPIKPKLKAADDRETFGWRLRRVDVPYLVHAFTKSAYFERYDA